MINIQTHARTEKRQKKCSGHASRDVSHTMIWQTKMSSIKTIVGDLQDINQLNEKQTDHALIPSNREKRQKKRAILMHTQVEHTETKRNTKQKNAVQNANTIRFAAVKKNRANVMNEQKQELQHHSQINQESESAEELMQTTSCLVHEQENLSGNQEKQVDPELNKHTRK